MILEQLSIFSLPELNYSLNHQAVLTPDQVRQIKAKLRSGKLSISALAHLYKVSRPTIRNIRDGKTWRWVD